VEKFEVGKHKGVIIDEAYDWDGGFTIFYCKTCKKLHIYTTELISGTTYLKDYTPNYICYPEIKAKAEKMGFKVKEAKP